ncbi:MAG TPA: adenylate kinase, partial [Paraburkholderia sp.]
KDEAAQLVHEVAKTDRWVIEGIYGSLVSDALSDATALIWLCLGDAECVANIQHRGIRRGGNEASLSALIRWAETYRSRDGSSSFMAHERLFEDFTGDKRCLRSRDEMTGLIKLLPN